VLGKRDGQTQLLHCSCHIITPGLAVCDWTPSEPLSPLSPPFCPCHRQLLQSGYVHFVQFFGPFCPRLRFLRLGQTALTYLFNLLISFARRNDGETADGLISPCLHNTIGRRWTISEQRSGK